MENAKELEIYFLDDYKTPENAFEAWKVREQKYHYFNKVENRLMPIEVACKFIDLDIKWLSDALIIHRAPWADNAWTITHVGTGTKIAAGDTENEAVARTKSIILEVGKEKFNRKVAEIHSVLTFINQEKKNGKIN